MSIAKKIKLLYKQGKTNLPCQEIDIKGLMFLKTKEKPIVLDQYIKICPASLIADPDNLWLPITGTINFFHMRNRSYFEQVLSCLEVFKENGFLFTKSFMALNKKEYSSYLEFVLIKSSHDFFKIAVEKVVVYMTEEDKEQTGIILKNLIDKNKQKKTVHFKNGNIKLLENFYEYHSLLKNNQNSNERVKKIL